MPGASPGARTLTGRLKGPVLCRSSSRRVLSTCAWGWPAGVEPAPAGSRPAALPLSYGHTQAHGVFWCRERASIPRRTRFQRAALPAELPRQRSIRLRVPAPPNRCGRFPPRSVSSTGLLSVLARRWRHAHFGCAHGPNPRNGRRAPEHGHTRSGADGGAKARGCSTYRAPSAPGARPAFGQYRGGLAASC